VEGAEDVRITAPPAVRLLEVVPEPLAAARLGMRASEVLAYVQAVRMGLDVGATYDGPLPVPIRVRYGKEEGALRFEALPLVTSQGQLVRLDAVAQVIRTEGPALANHHEAQRRIVVGFNVRERDLGSVMEDARRVVEEAVSLPSGYRQVWGGQWESLQSARARLGVVIPGVLLAILALLWALFHRLRPSLIILLNVPFAAIGGIVAL